MLLNYIDFDKGSGRFVVIVLTSLWGWSKKLNKVVYSTISETISLEDYKEGFWGIVIVSGDDYISIMSVVSTRGLFSVS